MVRKVGVSSRMSPRLRTQWPPAHGVLLPTCPLCRGPEVWLEAPVGPCPPWAQSPPAGGALGFWVVRATRGRGDSVPSSLRAEGEASGALEPQGRLWETPFLGSIPAALPGRRIFVIAVWGRRAAGHEATPFLPASPFPLQAGRPRGVCPPPPPRPMQPGARAEELGPVCPPLTARSQRNELPPSPPPAPQLPVLQARKVTPMAESHGGACSEPGHRPGSGGRPSWVRGGPGRVLGPWPDSCRPRGTVSRLGDEMLGVGNGPLPSLSSEGFGDAEGLEGL